MAGISAMGDLSHDSNVGDAIDGGMVTGDDHAHA